MYSEDSDNDEEEKVVVKNNPKLPKFVEADPENSGNSEVEDTPYVPTLLFLAGHSRFGRLSPVLPFDLKISRFERNISELSIFCKNSNMRRNLLHLLVFFSLVFIKLSLILQLFIIVFAKYVLKNDKTIILLN